MSNPMPILVALLVGVMLGSLFFGGLWWTVQRGLSSNNPALWFFGSTVLRTGLLVVGFYFIAAGDWEKLLACLIGFFIARIVVTRLTRLTGECQDASK